MSTTKITTEREVNTVSQRGGYEYAKCNLYGVVTKEAGKVSKLLRGEGGMVEKERGLKSYVYFVNREWRKSIFP